VGEILNQLATAKGYDAFAKVMEEIEKIVDIVVSAFYGLVLACLVFICIYVGFQMARAEDEGKRKNAKAQMFYAIVGIIGVGMMLVLLRLVLPAGGGISITFGGGKVEGLESTAKAISLLLNTILNILLLLIGVFGCYVAWQFIRAENEEKRKQAKTQLLYCFIAIVGIALLNLVATTVFKLAAPSGGSGGAPVT